MVCVVTTFDLYSYNNIALPYNNSIWDCKVLKLTEPALMLIRFKWARVEMKSEIFCHQIQIYGSTKGAIFLQFQNKFIKIMTVSEIWFTRMTEIYALANARKYGCLCNTVSESLNSGYKCFCHFIL